MSKQVNIQQGVLYPQPDYSLSIDKEGKWTGTYTYLCHRLSITQLLPRPGTAHPECSFIGVDSATAKVIEGDLAEITCNYAGTEARTPEQEKNSMVFSMGESLSEEPILTAFRYKDLPDAEKEALQAIMAGKDKDGSTTYKSKVTSDRGKECLAKITRGQVSYYSPKVTWKASVTRNSGVTAADLNKVGKISSPFGPCPSLADNRNWLFNGVNQSQEGKAFRIEWEWLASDPGGWDPDFYT